MHKIRVLQIYSVMNMGGAETFIINVFRNINRNNVQFDFLCTTNEVGFYDSEISKLGGRILHYNHFHKNNPFHMIRDTKKIIKENGPYDVIHIPLQFYSALFCIVAKKCKIKKIIVHSHSAGDREVSSLKRRMYMKFMRFIINRYSNIRIACGEKASEYLFGTTDNVKIVYNGIDIDKYLNVNKNETDKLRKKYHVDSEIVIGHVGRFANVKNHKFFIDIARNLVARKVKFKIFFVGDGPNIENVKELIKKNNLEKYFVFAGSQKDTQFFYAMFNVFVMPSLYEGFPISATEALASGVPCVLSNTITREVDIINNSCSFIDLNDNIDYWCDEILRLAKLKLDKKVTCKILNEMGFSISSATKSIWDIYNGG